MSHAEVMEADHDNDDYYNPTLLCAHIDDSHICALSRVVLLMSMDPR
jgi:hypothetical protein